jgi:transposase
MAKGFRPVDRDQQFLLPVDMREWLPGEHPVWMVLEVIEHLDLSRLRSWYALGGAGRRAYDPGMLLALLIYAYADGIRSSRQIERLCRTDVAMRVVCASEVPDHTVIARFRQLHQESVRDLFVQVLLVCAKAGLGRLGTIAIDGTKIAADASRSASCRRQWLQEQVDAITAQAEAVDAAEDADASVGSEGQDSPRRLLARADRVQRLQRALAEVIAEEAERGLDDAAVAAKEREFVERTRRGDNKVGSRPLGADPVKIAEARLEAAQQRLAEQIMLKREKITLMREKIAQHEAGQGPKPNLGPFSFDETRGQDVARAKRWVARAERELVAARRARSDTSQPSQGPQPVESRGVPGGGRHGPRSKPSKDDRPQVRRNVTDVDSRLMRDADGGSLQGYNAQLAVSDDGLILCPVLVQDANDRRQLQPMSQAVVEMAGHVHRARCTRRCVAGHGCCVDLPPTVPPRNSAVVTYGCGQDACPCLADWVGTLLFDNGYWTEDNLVAPGPDRLIATGKNRDLPHPDETSEPLSDDADAGTRMAYRLATSEGAALYKRRGATVEPVHGHLKERTGLRRFARRGLAACQAELDFAALVLNLRKLWRVDAHLRSAALTP